MTSRVLAITALVLLTGFGAAWGLRWWAAAPAPVPDHATVHSGTQAMTVAGIRTLGQTFRPLAGRLTAIDLLLAAEEPGLPGDIRLDVFSAASGERLRTSRVPAAALPTGSPWSLRPGQPGEQWTAFGFEPIDDSGGRELLFVLSYPDAADRPGSRVATLARFPRSYGRGEMVVNEFPASGNLLFRATRAGTRGEALAVAATNVSRVQPLAVDTLAAPLLAGVLCAALAVSIVWVLGPWRGDARAVQRPGGAVTSGTGSAPAAAAGVEFGVPSESRIDTTRPGRPLGK